MKTHRPFIQVLKRFFSIFVPSIRFMHEIVKLNQKPVDMKRRSIIFCVMSLFLFLSCEEETKEALEDKNETMKTQSNSTSQESGDVKAAGGGTTIIFGTKCCPNEEATGCEGDKGFCLIIKSECPEGAEVKLGKGEGLADASVTSDRKILLGIKEDYYEDNKGDKFHVSKDHELSQEVTRALGYDQVTLQKGVYDVDYSQESEYPFGVVELEADLKK